MQASSRAIIVVLSLFFLGITASCKQPAQTAVAKADTLDYVYKTITNKLPDCKGEDAWRCTILQIKYPVFADSSALNDSLQRAISIFFKYNFANIEDFASNYAVESIKLSANPDPGLAPLEHIKRAIKVIKQGGGLLAIRVDDYQAGRKPLAKDFIDSYYFNWDSRKNTSISLKDILTPNYLAKLNAAAEPVFRKQEGLNDTVDLSSIKQPDGRPFYKFANGKFTVYEDRFSITPAGLKFRYNAFDAKAYDAGPCEVLVPYSKIKSILRPNTVVSQYVK